MKIKFLPVLIAIAAAAGITSMQEASAQESRGARFNYAPNIWKAEEPRMPRGYQAPPQHAVRSGAVPKGNDFLGLDNIPTHRAQPTVAPIVTASNVNAVPTIPRTTAQFVPKQAFNPSFGNPLSATPAQPLVPQVARNPAPMPVPARAAQPQVARAIPVGKPVSTGRRHHTSTGVSGRLASRPKPSGAAATPQALSYDRGYVPGGSIAAANSGAGRNSNATLNGRVLNAPKHLKY